MNKIEALADEEVLCRAGPHPIVFGRALWSLLLGWAFWEYIPKLTEHYYWIFDIYYTIWQHANWISHLNEIIAIYFILSSIYIFITGVLMFRSTEILVSNRRIIVRYGIWDTVQTEVERSKIAGVIIQRPAVGRLLGYGWVIINGYSGALVVLPAIYKPYRVQQAISKSMEAMPSAQPQPQ